MFLEFNTGKMLSTIFLSLLSVYLVGRVATFHPSIVNVILANEDPQYFDVFSKSLVNVTFNLSSVTNISNSLEQCADAGSPYLFVENNTILGCGSLLRTDNDRVLYPGNSNTFSTLNINPSKTIIISPDINISSTIQASNTTLGFINSSIPLNINWTNSISGVAALNDTISLNGTYSVSVLNGTLLLNNTDSITKTISQSNDTVIKTSSLVLSISEGAFNSTRTPSSNSGYSVGITIQPSISSNDSYSMNKTISQSNSKLITSNLVPSDNVSDSRTPSSNSVYSVGAAIQPSVSSNDSYSMNETISQSNGTLILTSSLVPSISDHVFNNTRIPSSSFSATITILPSSAGVYNLKSSEHQARLTSNQSSITPHPSLSSTVQLVNSSCRDCNSTTDLVKAYKTEHYGVVTLSLFTNLNFTLRVQNAVNFSVNCSFIPGDNTPVVVVETNLSLVSFFHRYFKSGRYRARIKCIQNGTVLLHASRRVFVDLPLVHNAISCPELFQTNVTDDCTFTVDQATLFDVLVDAGNLRNSFGFPETSLDVVSVKNVTTGTLNNLAFGLYSSLLILKKAFYIRCVELVSHVAGTLTLKIFRPLFPLNVSSEPFSNLSCNENSTRNSSSRGNICFQTFAYILRSSSLNLVSTDFTVVHNMTLTINVGYNFIILPNADIFKANPGDVIGYFINQSDGFNSLPMSRNSSISPNQTSSGQASPESQKNKSFNIFQTFSLYGFVPYEAQISIRFLNPGVLPLRLAIGGLRNTSSNFRNTITIERAVSRLTFKYKPIIRINTSHLIGFELSHGTNSSCDWLLIGSRIKIEGSVNYTVQVNYSVDGDTLEGLKTSFQYPHDVPEDIKFLVNCSNKVSTLSKNVTISVRRNISNFKASLCFASFAYTHARTCWDSKANGEHIGYKWIIENEVYDTAKVEMKFQSNSVPNNRTLVKVKLDNVVSEKKAELTLDVLKNPLNIKFLPAFTVASEENVTIIPILNWSPYPNGTALYLSYGINISDSLKTFINFPTFRIKIDDLPKYENISNGTSLTHKFKTVGSEAATHDVYIEATEHQEMNREIQVRVFDKVGSLQIITNCSSEVVIGKSCTFKAKFDGSDVICNWRVGSQNFKDTCKIKQSFNDLGNFTLNVTANNQISSQDAVYNITVVPKHSSSIWETWLSTTSLASQSNTLEPRFSLSPSTTLDYAVTARDFSSTKSLLLNTASSVSFTNLKLSFATVVSGVLRTTSISSPEFVFNTSKTILGLPSEIDVSLSTHGPSSRSIGPSSRSVSPGIDVLKITGPHFAAVGQKVTFHALNVAPSAKLFWIINNTNVSTFNNNVSYIFNKAGEFIVVASTSTSNQNANFTISVQDPISGFKAFVYQKAFSKRVDVLFAIDSGTNVSYTVDFGDGSETIVGTIRELGENISKYHVYSSPGYYNLSILVFSKVGPNNSQYTKIFVNTTCQLQSANLYGASKNEKNPRRFTEEDKIVIYLKAILNCYKTSQLKYIWSLERLASGIPDGLSIELPNTHESIFRFSASQISDGDYKIRVRVENPMDGTSVTRVGYFSKDPQNLNVRIACGTSRIVSVDKPLNIVSSAIVSSGNITYEWFCYHVLNVACYGNEIIRNMSVLHFPGNYFKVGDVFEFTVKANNGKWEGVASQRVSFGLANKALDLCLSSSEENKHSVLVTKDITITPSCSNCFSMPNLIWSWHISKVVFELNSTAKYALHNLIVNSSVLFLPANILQHDTSYKVQLNVTNLTRNITGYSSYEFKTNDVPMDGFCDVQPYESAGILNAFQTSCYAWYDRDQPLTYEYWYAVDGVNYTAFYRGKKPVSGQTFFEEGTPERNFEISVKVIIKDALEEQTMVHLTVKNPPLSDEKIAEILNSPEQIDNQVEILINDTNVQGAVQFLKTTSRLLNKKSGDSEENSKRTKIRERTLHNLKKLCCSDSVVVTHQIIEVMLSVASTPSELNLDAQLYASTILLDITRSFPFYTNSEVINMSEKLATGISMVLTAVSLLNNSNTSKIKKINEASLLAVDSLTDIILNQTNPGEPAINLTTSQFTIAVQKHFSAKFPGTRLVLPNQITEFIVPRKLKSIEGPFVSSKMISMSTNPFIWQNLSYSLRPTTGVSSLVLLESAGLELKIKDLDESFDILLDPQGTLESQTEASVRESSQSVANYTSTLTEDSDPDLYEINTTRSDSAILVTIPKVTSDNKGQLRIRLRRANQSYSTGKEFIVLSTSSFPVFLTWRGLEVIGIYYVSVEFESLAFRPAGRPNSIQYSVVFQEISCHYWDISNEQWRSDGCQVGLRSSSLATNCECNHLTWFGGRLVVPPNSISFTKVAERIKDPRNYITILSTLSSVLVLYCLVLVWARRRDIKDERENGITWCSSNHMTDTHQYQVIVYTGIRRNAGTTANVGLMLSGELGKSRKCLLKSSKRDVLKRGHVDSFLVTTSGSLGPLDYLYIWHDNSGSDPAWFLNRVVVLDSETGLAENFLCYRWLAVDEGDGHIQRLLPTADIDDLKRFRHLFVSRATSELTDAHLWFSVAFRPVSSPFTRVQRVSCCLTLLLTSMMANAMWYQTADSGNSSQIDLVLFSFSWDEFFIGVCSSLIVFPINLLLVEIFRHCRCKNKPSRNRQPSFFSPQNMRVKPAFLNLRKSVSVLGSREGSPETCDQSRDVSPVMMVTSPRPTLERCRKTSEYSYIVVSPSGPKSVTSLQSRVNSPSQQGNRLKDNNLLPYWFQYIAWIGVLVTCLTSAAVTFLYAIEFGEEKTRNWLLSLAISLVNDIFIAQPSKVLLVTVVLAYILKRPLKERYASDDVIEQEEFEAMPTQGTEPEAPDFNLCTASEFLRAAREKREKDKFMFRLMKDVFSHLCFTVLVLIIAYGQRDLMGYHLTSTQENTFVVKSFKEQSLKKQDYSFYQVANDKDFWLWHKTVLVPGLSNKQWHNYTTEWSTFTANFGGFLFGAARLRQKRLKKVVCHVLPELDDVIPDCSGNYEWRNEDEASYVNSWNKPTGDKNVCSIKNGSTLPPDHWCYTRLNGMLTAPYVGRLETYPEGGYNQIFNQNYEASLDLTGELKNHQWIDRYTRAVFVEFTLYNPNVNLFSITTLLFEISSTGDFNPGTNFLSIRLYNYVGNFQIFVLICQLLFLGFLCVYTYNSAKGIFREKCRFLAKPWNAFDIILVLISWLAVAIYFVAIVFRDRILREFREDPTQFTSFRHSVSWQMSLEYAIAILVFMISLKFLRLFQFNRRMFLLPLTLSNTAYDMLSYTIVFSIILVAFSLLYHLILQAYDPNFLNMVVTIQTLLHVLVGKSDMLVKRHQFPVLERFTIFIYMCVMKFILLNIFIVILNDGFSRAKAKNDAQQNAFEFIDFIKNTVNEMLGIRRLNVAKKISTSVKSRRVKFDEKNLATNVEYTLMNLEKKVDKLLNLVQSERFEEIFNE